MVTKKQKEAQAIKQDYNPLCVTGAMNWLLKPKAMVVKANVYLRPKCLHISF